MIRKRMRACLGEDLFFRLGLKCHLASRNNIAAGKSLHCSSSNIFPWDMHPAGSSRPGRATLLGIAHDDLQIKRHQSMAAHHLGAK